MGLLSTCINACRCVTLARNEPVSQCCCEAESIHEVGVVGRLCQEAATRTGRDPGVAGQGVLRSGEASGVGRSRVVHRRNRPGLTEPDPPCNGPLFLGCRARTCRKSRLSPPPVWVEIITQSDNDRTQGFYPALWISAGSLSP